LRPSLITLSFPGDTAVALLKEGADFTLKTNAEELAMDLAPDKEVRINLKHDQHKFLTTLVFPYNTKTSHLTLCQQVRRYILQGAEREGIELSG
jgi:26S proteasome non-ATPase regulatory subunit 10